MRQIWPAVCMVACFLCLAVCVEAGFFAVAPPSIDEKAQRVSICQLRKDPAAYNHRLVEVEAFAAHGFEDFSLFDPACPGYPPIWLEYGGTAKSDTIYCCGPTGGTSRPAKLVIEDIPVPLVENDLFHRFDQRIHRPDHKGSMTHTTIVGRFFAGSKETYPNGQTAWEGFGHFGCCSLLAIQEIKNADFDDRGDLEAQCVPMVPMINTGHGCGIHDLMTEDAAREMIESQKRADSGSRAWAFDDPRRVAFEVIQRNETGKPPDPSFMHETGKAKTHHEYELKWMGAHKTFSISVCRPYWLSF